MKKIISITAILFAYISQPAISNSQKIPSYESPLNLEKWRQEKYTECMKDCEHAARAIHSSRNALEKHTRKLKNTPDSSGGFGRSIEKVFKRLEEDIPDYERKKLEEELRSRKRGSPRSSPIEDPEIADVDYPFYERCISRCKSLFQKEK